MLIFIAIVIILVAVMWKGDPLDNYFNKSKRDQKRPDGYKPLDEKDPFMYDPEGDSK